MKIDTFVREIKGLNRDNNLTSQLKVKVITSSDDTIKIIHSEASRCKCCGHLPVPVKLYVFFKKPHRLTIFEAGMLYSIFINKKRPYDYAKWHKCVAGKKFIENIDKIKFANRVIR